MGGCASKPKELDGSTIVAPIENFIAEPEVTVNPAEADAPKEEVKTETTAESKEAPLVDISSPKAEDVKSPVSELAPEIKQLTTDEPVKAEPKVVKEDAAPEQNFAPAAEEKEVTVKAEEVKEPVVVVVAEEKNVSA